MGYHQVEVHPDDCKKTAFSTPFGLFQYNVLPFGLAAAFATFMPLLTIVLFGMLYTTCLVYLDSIINFGRNYIKMLDRLDTAFERLGQANFKLKPSEFAFGKTSVKIILNIRNFLGNVIRD